MDQQNQSNKPCKTKSQSLNEPGMSECKNCQCESIRSHVKTGATTRL